MAAVFRTQSRARTSSVRERLLAAAAQVFACYGAAGATTRRIAAEAHVNEVTLFRHFGSKEALLDAAVQASVQHLPTAPLPTEPEEPLTEITAWCENEMQRLGGAGGLLQHCFAESVLRPEQGMQAGDVILDLHTALHRYVEALQRSGRAVNTASVTAAVAMLVSVLVSDALGREQMDRMFPPRNESAHAYSQAFLRLLDVRESHIAV
ncbi:MAG: TetR/AcrR family transcriptional regulator [Gemmatimonadaceae bacterium]|nr:TetR/AcrR family transcriptional regulator [Gemmatimonadaceae bacterium]